MDLHFLLSKRRSGLLWISAFLLILMVISPPFSHTSTGGRKMAEGLYKSRQAEMEIESSRRGYSNGVEKECERQVPTGPDPLHHNSNPSP